MVAEHEKRLLRQTARWTQSIQKTRQAGWGLLQGQPQQRAVRDEIGRLGLQMETQNEEAAVGRVGADLVVRSQRLQR